MFSFFSSKVYLMRVVKKQKIEKFGKKDQKNLSWW